MRYKPETAFTLCLAAFLATLPARAEDFLSCDTETRATISAVRMRDQGKTREQLLAPLPTLAQTKQAASSSSPQAQSGARLSMLMHSIVDDIYSNPQVAVFPYYVYRSVSCANRLAGQPVPQFFSEVSASVLACQEQHGVDQSVKLTDCIASAVDAYRPK
jgi:hypothetical protein